VTKRWLSQDPLGFGAGDSNLYRYVNNRSTNATDPSGKTEDDINSIITYVTRILDNKAGDCMSPEERAYKACTLVWEAKTFAAFKELSKEIAITLVAGVAKAGYLGKVGEKAQEVYDLAKNIKDAIEKGPDEIAKLAGIVENRNYFYQWKSEKGSVVPIGMSVSLNPKTNRFILVYVGYIGSAKPKGVRPEVSLAPPYEFFTVVVTGKYTGNYSVEEGSVTVKYSGDWSLGSPYKLKKK
jgi:hypothetical protein